MFILRNVAGNCPIERLQGFRRLPTISISTRQENSLNFLFNMQVYIVSLKYAPGLAKEFLLLGDNIASSFNGARVGYILSQGYDWLIEEKKRNLYSLTTSRTTREMAQDTFTFLLKTRGKLQELFRQNPPGFLCLYNPHPLNFAVLKAARQINPRGIRAIYLHEPYKPDKSSFGRAGSFYFALAEFFQTLSLKYTNCIIVPSSHAYELFQQRYPQYAGAVHIAPILLPDRSPVERGQARKYVSLVGNINRSRGLDLFIQLINYTAAQGKEIQFKIVTRSRIAQDLQNVSAKGRRLLSIVNKPSVSDAEIAATLAQSYALFLPHKQVTQSGNVPVSFREGTPIIARNLPGFAQHVQHKQNGFLLPVDPSPAQLLDAVCYIQDNFASLSRSARATFAAIFSEKNWPQYYRWLIE